MSLGRRACVAILAAAAAMAGASGPARALEIAESRVEATVASGGSVVVAETVVFDTSDGAAPWFERRLATTSADDPGGVPRTVELLSVVGLDGQPVAHDVVRGRGAVVVRVPVADRDGVRFLYRLTGVLRRDAAHDEVVLDVPGFERPLVVRRASLSVSAPAAPTGTACARGVDPTQADAWTPGCGTTTGARAEFDLGRLDPGVGFVGVVAYGPRALGRVPLGERARQVVRVHVGFWLLLPAAGALALLVGLARLRQQERRAADARQLPPERMSPAEVGLLWRGHHDKRDMVATVVDLGRRGHLRAVVRLASDDTGWCAEEWSLRRVESSDGLRPFEDEVVRALFGGAESVDVAQAGARLRAVRARFRRGVARALAQQGRAFATDPERADRGLALVGAVCVGLAAGSLFAGAAGPALGFGLSAPLAFLGRRATALRTGLGASVRGEIAGFERFVRSITPAALRIAIQSPEGHFTRLQPYAIALDLADPLVETYEAAGYRPADGWIDGDGAGMSRVHAHDVPPLEPIARLVSALNAALADPRARHGAQYTRPGDR